MHLNKVVKYIVVLVLLISFSCNNSKDPIKIEKEFVFLSNSKNILNYTYSPNIAFDKNGLMFSDQGAWFAYSFPDTISNFGGFSGPFLMTQQNGVWSSANLSQLVLNGVNWKSIKTNSYASHLEQVFKSDSLELKQQLVFSSGHSAIIKSIIKNSSNKDLNISFYWKNQPILAEGIQLTSLKNEVLLQSSKTNAIGRLLFPEGTVIKNNDSTYVTEPEKVSLKPNEVKEITISHTFIFPEYSKEKEKESVLAASFDLVLKNRKSEKEAELSLLKNNLKLQFKDSVYQQVLAKSHLTLQNNWRIAAGELKYEGLFPSYHYEWFNGFWSWDSWKHAVGLSYYNTKLAKNQMRALFDFQKEDGFIVDCIYRDTTIEAHNYRDTKPPLSAWAVVKIYDKYLDTTFVKELYPKLKKYHYWWYNKRDYDKDGLCEYGSTDGSLIAAKW